MRGRPILVAALFLLIGCGDETSPTTPGGGGEAGSGGEGGGGAFTPPTYGPLWDGCQPGEADLEGSCVAAGIPAEACGPYFEPDGDGSCEPILPPEDCPEGELAIPGQTTCAPVAPCASGTWAGIPTESTTQYVDQSYSGTSTGTASQPWTTIGAAMAAAVPNAIVAIGPGTYVESVEVETKPLRLWGKCPAEVAVVASGTYGIRFDNQQGEVHRLKVTGTRGISLQGDAEALIEEVWIDGCNHGIEAVCTPSVTPSTTVRRSLISMSRNRGIYGIGGAITVESSVIRDTNPTGEANASQAIEHGDLTVSTGLGELTVRRSLIERGRLHGIETTGVNVVLEDLVIRDIEATDQPLESAIHLVGSLVSEQRANLDADRLYLERVGGGGLRLLDMLADIEVLIVKDTAPTVDNTEGGEALDVWSIGLTSSTEPSEATLRFASIDRVHSRAIVTIGGVLHLEAVRVRDVSPWVDGTAGQGLLLQECSEPSHPAAGTVNGLVVERAHEAGIAISGGTAEVAGALVLDTQQRPAGGFGRGVLVQDDLLTHFGTAVTLRRSWVRGATEAGVGALGADLVVEDVRVDDVGTGALDGGACFNFQALAGVTGSVQVSRAHGEGC
ncbi:MAG: hypothetical protein JRI68_02300, partial [Deltaproteobacteria bacterium]|nr:hypothetical protein [Deltaproteobacteria bacterium]